MRIISRQSHQHKETPTYGKAATFGGLLLLGILTLWGIAGCNTATTDQAPGDTQAVTTFPACPVTLDTSSWRVFVASGQKIMAGEIPTDTDLEAFARTPDCGAWRRSLAPLVPSPSRCGNWLAAAFMDKLGDRFPGKVSSDRRTMAATYRYSYDHQAPIDSLLVQLSTSNRLCQWFEKLPGWIDPENLPDHLVIATLPGRPEIRAQQDTILIDTGVLVAGGIDQTLAQTASLLYRQLQVPGADNPNRLRGEEAIVGSLLLFRNEGVAGYLENRSETYFRRDHPSLSRVNLRPQEFVFTAIRLVALADSTLPALLNDPVRLDLGAQDFSRTLTASGGFAKLGYVMAATIAGNLGEKQLQTSSRTVSGFLDSFQKAAALNPLPSPTPGAKGYPWYAAARPFDHDLYLKFKALLESRGM